MNMFGVERKIMHLAGVYSKLYRKSVIRDIGSFFDERLINGEDMIFNANIILQKNDIEVVPSSIYCICVNRSSATKQFNSNIVESDKAFHEILYKLLIRGGLGERDSEALRKFCLKNAVFTLTQKFSYLDTYKQAEEFFFLFKQYPYSEATAGKIGNRHEIIVILIQHGWYRAAYLLCRVHHRIKFRKEKNYIQII